MKLGLYVHIPFCHQKCLYCDFPSYANLTALYQAYTAALCKEIYTQGGILSQETVVDTVYLGGGTPTILPEPLLLEIIQAVRDSFSFSPDMEFTIEVNPGTAGGEKLAALYQAGVNRISFGVQSFEDHLLKKIGRMHTAKEAKDAIYLAKSVGFENISLDLMYGLPTQTLGEVKNSLDEALALDITHISVYGLKVEEDTPFDALQRAGKLALPDADLEAAMYDEIMQMLPAKGYERYEISNFAKIGFESRHNLKYWQNQPYVGLGAAAHSYLESRRYANTVDVKQYIAFLKEDKTPVTEMQELKREHIIEEFCFLALRTKRGISIPLFNEKFNCNFFSIYGHSIDNLKMKGLLTGDETNIYLTELGMKYGNQVFYAFLLK